jgi:hypothetical protein
VGRITLITQGPGTGACITLSRAPLRARTHPQPRPTGGAPVWAPTLVEYVCREG